MMTPSEMGKKGGKKSAERRFAGMTKEEISAMMKKLRRTPQSEAETKKLGEALAENLNRNVK